MKYRKCRRIESEFPAPKHVREAQPKVPTLALFFTVEKALRIEVPDHLELYFIYHGYT